MSITEPSYDELKARVAELENQLHTCQVELEGKVMARTAQWKQALSDLERSYDLTLEMLGDALDLKDAEAEGHAKRVTVLTIAMARALRLPPEQIRVIARSAFLHDIGLLAIPDAILHKPGALTHEELAIMQEHCYRGYQMLHKIPFLMEAAEIVYAHEERWDGTGYPRGLKGSQIPLGARLFAIADVVDEIMSGTATPAERFSAARDEVIRRSGRQLDPEAVKTFLTIPETIWHELRKEIDQQISRSTAYARKPT